MSSTQQLILGEGAGGVVQYKIERSLRFNSADSAYLNRTPASAGNRKTWTWSGWVKRSALGASTYFFGAYSGSGSDTTLFTVSFNASDQLDISAFTQNWRVTSQVFRDVGAWYHIVIAFDTTQATAGDRVKLYVNGTQVTAFGASNNPTQNTDYVVNNTVAHYVGVNPFTGNSAYFNGYMTEINFIDGQALTPSSFGETDTDTGVWKPKAYSGSYGTNGFYLKFADNSGTTSTTLGKDSSGNGNNWTPNNFSVTAGVGNDSLVDTPTPYGTDTGAGGEVRGNYCTANPLDSGGVTCSNGNLKIAFPTDSNYNSIRSTLGLSSGKWYWEVVSADITSLNPRGFVGIADAATTLANNFVGNSAGSWGFYNSSGTVFNNGSESAYGSQWLSNVVIGVAFDADNGKLWFSASGTYPNSGNPANGTNPAFSSIPSKTYFPAFSMVGSNQGTFDINFGQRPFAYTAPSGFKALCTQNLPTPTIGATATTRADDYFNTVLYTGTGSSLGVTGVGFQPDFVWIKERNAAADHALYDAVRGVQQQLESNTTTDETTESTGLTAFGSDGFTVGSLAQVNTSTDTYVAWNWKESTVSKFDIVTYTGNGTARTISHNLGVVPNMIIVKARTTASTDQGWPVYHSANTANPETDYLLLNSTAATADLDTVWNDTAPTSSVFSVGTNALVNANNDTYVAYLFANVAGYSAFGSYTGNGSADGPFVYTGFRPAWVMIKRTNDTSSWNIVDVKRNTYNVMNTYLSANTTNADDSTYALIDSLSNGFKVRQSLDFINQSTGTFIYAAFAEFPFKYTLAR